MQSVLVVEDDAAFAEALQAYLTSAGFEVEVAADTIVALDKVDRRDYDMLVVDIVMPSGKPNGWSLARMVRMRKAIAKIIFLTGHRELAAIADQLPGRLLFKPLMLETIVSEIRSELAA